MSIDGSDSIAIIVLKLINDGEIFFMNWDLPVKYPESLLILNVPYLVAPNDTRAPMKPAL